MAQHRNRRSRLDESRYDANSGTGIVSKPFIIPIFLPNAGCPHRCVFCDQRAISGQTAKRPASTDVGNTIEGYLPYRKRGRSYTQVSFYGGNFLGLPFECQSRLLKEASRYVQLGEVDSIRFSTRPDTITPIHLDRIEPYPVSTIELGAQSMDNQVLAASERGHTAEDTIRAVDLLKSRGYEVGLQIMLGLPGDTGPRAMATARTAAALCPDLVRIYPTVVLKNSTLAAWADEGKYVPISLDSAVQLTKQMYVIFAEQGIPVVRMGLQSSSMLTASVIAAGPYHPAFGHLVLSALFLDKAVSALEALGNGMEAAVLSVHPASISKARGYKNRNIAVLKQRFNYQSISVAGNESLAEDEVTARAL